MKIVLLVLILPFVSVVHAFSAGPRPPTVRPDSSVLVEEALKVTAAYGIESKEAALAWETVEEMDASDNSQASAGSLNDECDLTDEEQSIPCMDYGRFLDELYVIRELMGEKKEGMKKASLAQTLKAIKLQKPEGAAAKHSKELTGALEAAKIATSDYGVTSPQAQLAWETYEEIASSGFDNAIGVNLEDECHIESGQESCRAIEELDRVMAVLLAMSIK